MIQTPQDGLYDRARQAIRDLKDKLAAAEAGSRPSPVAVIGMGIRFPGAGHDLERFWEMIRDGEDATTEIPADRWDREAFYSPANGTPGKMNTRRAAFIENVSHFDASFFDITPHEAARMDPQQRIFLQTAWQAIEDAGLTRRNLSGSNTGTFVGIHTHSSDYQAMLFGGSSAPDAYAGSGTAHDMIGGRLAYWLDLHGPSLTVNTACSSSLMAVHLACSSIRNGECDVAIAAGINLLLKPVSTVAAAQLQLLAPDGRCKTFDARADGMGRGEGCGVVVLKSLVAAQRDGDRIHAVIRGSAANQDGRTNGLTAPNGLAQQRVMRRALQNAGVSEQEIGYVETHGTGTALGDPVEVEALAEVFGARTPQVDPAAVGAVKANIGHLEGAAGIAGLIKTVLVLRHRWIPPVAKLQELNPHLQAYASALNFPRQGRSWETSARRRAGVSSYGWSGTNVHVILEDFDQPSSMGLSSVLPLLMSAASQQALDRLVSAYVLQLQRTTPSQIADFCYTSAVRRTHHVYRIGVCGRDREQLVSAIRAKRSGEFSDRANNVSLLEMSRSIVRWEMGEEVDWLPFFGSQQRVLPGPVYAFEPARHWIRTKTETTSAVVPSNWFYETDWVAAPLLKPDALKASSGFYLLIQNGREKSDRLAETVRQAGHQLLVVRRGSHYSVQSSTTLATVTNLSTDMARLFEDITRESSAPSHLLYQPGFENASGETADLLELSQWLVRQAAPLRLSVVSVGAGGSSSGTSARGFNRAFALEYPRLAGPYIELDVLNDENVAALLNELVSRTGEGRVRLRDGRRYVARLRQLHWLGDLTPIRMKPDRSYLVTGAFGRLGLHVARWMVESGAGHLVLIGRRNALASTRASVAAEIDELRCLGATVVTQACDVSDERQVRSLLEGLAASPFPLAGIVHGAADNCFGPIADATPEDVRRVFSAKLDGAHILDRCTRNETLDFFVVFGSAAATIGMREAALYAAANSSLDEIVQRRKAEGLPGLCVEWGFWDEQGAESDPQRQRQLLHESGFLPMPPKSAVQVLGQLIVSGRSAALVAAIDWARLLPLLEAQGAATLVEEIAIVPGSEQLAVADSLGALHSLGATERSILLLELVTAEVRRVFGMSPDHPVDEDRGLFQLGMNSLMSVALKRHLEQRTGLRLPGTLTFSYPSIKALAGYLSERIAPETVDDPRIANENENVAQILQMSKSDTAAAIAAEVASVNERMGRR